MKETFGSVEDILDFAIGNEIEANRFYTDLASRMENPAIRKVFEDFAREELGHKAKLEAVKAGQFPVEGRPSELQSLEIADYLVEIEPKPDMSYADALIIAMKKEKAAYRLYLDLASAVATKELSEMFLMLAQEEARHKLRFEIEYDDEVFKDN